MYLSIRLEVKSASQKTEINAKMNVNIMTLTLSEQCLMLKQTLPVISNRRSPLLRFRTIGQMVLLLRVFKTHKYQTLLMKSLSGWKS